MHSTEREAIEALVVSWSRLRLPKAFFDQDGEPLLHFEWQNAPRPRPPYMSINTTARQSIGLDEHRDLVGDGVVDEEAQTTGYELEVVAQRSFTLSLQTHGRTSTATAKEAHDAMEAMQDSLSQPSIVGLFGDSNVTAMLDDGVQDTSADIGQGMEDRAALDISCLIATMTLDDVGRIETAEISGTVKKGEEDPNPRSVSLTVTQPTT